MIIQDRGMRGLGQRAGTEPRRWASGDVRMKVKHEAVVDPAEGP